MVYFLNYEEGDFTDGNYFYTILSSVMPDALGDLILKARQRRSVKVCDNQDEFSRLGKASKTRLCPLSPKRVNAQFFDFNFIISRRRVSYLLKGKAILNLNRKKPRTHEYA